MKISYCIHYLYYRIKIFGKMTLVQMWLTTNNGKCNIWPISLHFEISCVTTAQLR